MNHFEGFGGNLNDRHSVRLGFEAHYGEDWSWVNVPIKLQSDGYNCGVWIQVRHVTVT